MTKQTRKILMGWFVIIIVTVASSLPIAASPGISIPRWQNTTVNLGPGFGNSWNKDAHAIQDFKGYLYVGTKNVHVNLVETLNDQGFQGCMLNLPQGDPSGIFDCLCPGGECYQVTNYAEIWRYNYSGCDWEQVYGVNINPAQQSRGFREMAVFQGKLYASSNDANGNPEILHTADGKNWTKFSTPPDLKPGTTAFNSMEVFEDRLYIGTENALGGELWYYYTNPVRRRSRIIPILWNKVSIIGTATSITELAVMGDYLYVGTKGPDVFGWALHRVDKEGTVVNITPTQVGAIDVSNTGTTSVRKLYPFHNKLYVGTENSDQGFLFLRYSNMTADPSPTNDNGWEIITSDGFGDPRNTSVWSMTEFKGVLYMGTYTTDFLSMMPDFLYRQENVMDFDPSLLAGSAQLWHSSDGMDWEKEMNPSAGFGIWDHGFRNMAVGNNGTQLFLGTSSNLFAPDAMELIALLYGGQAWIFNVIPPFLQNIIWEMNPKHFPAWVIEGLLPQAIGPGTEIWTLNPEIMNSLD